MKIKDLVPPGYDANKLIKRLAVSLAAVFVISGCMVISGFEESLTIVKRLALSDETVTMPDFNVFMKGRLFLFFLYYLICLYLMIMFFRSFYSHSKSIYTMKRIENSWELRLRITGLPLRYIILGLAAAGVLLMIFKNVYFSVTPAQLQPAFNGINFWRIFL